MQSAAQTAADAVRARFALLWCLEDASVLASPNEYRDSEILGSLAGFNNKLVELACSRRGIRTLRISGGTFLALLDDGAVIPFHLMNNYFQSVLANKLTRDKLICKELLKLCSVPTPAGDHFRRSEYPRAKAEARKLYPEVVVKPVDGSGGKGITVGIDDDAAFDRAWASAQAATAGRILVEERFGGRAEARFVVIDGRCVSVTGRIPPLVIGDGVASIRKLIAEKNARRRANPGLASKTLVVSDAVVRNIGAQGYDLDSVVPADAIVVLDDKAGLSSGADSIQLIDHVHPSYMDTAVRAAAAIPGNLICGVDVIAHDFGTVATADNHVVIEVNSAPGLAGHHFPVYGRVVDVAGMFVEACVSRASMHPDVQRFYDLPRAAAKLAATRNLAACIEDALAFDAEEEASHAASLRLVQVYAFDVVDLRRFCSVVQAFCLEHDIDGFVRPRSDGSAMIRARGKEAGIAALIEALESAIQAGEFSKLSVAKSRQPVRRGFVIRKMRTVHPQSLGLITDAAEVTKRADGAQRRGLFRKLRKRIRQTIKVWR